jgi:hypothetical protein
MTEEHKRKISEAQKGRIFTPEHRQKLSAARAGRSPWNKGIPVSEVTKEKLRAKATARPSPLKGIPSGRTPWNKGRHWTSEERQRISLIHKGKPLSKLHRQAIGRSLIGKFAGPKNPAWRGGTSTTRQKFMNSAGYKEWRNAVFVRDDYRCLDCGNRTGPLNAHHIYPWAFYPRLRLMLENGITLCVECHKTTPNYLKKPAELNIYSGLIFQPA